jgi:hypothetical protein
LTANHTANAGVLYKAEIQGELPEMPKITEIKTLTTDEHGLTISLIH